VVGKINFSRPGDMASAHESCIRNGVMGDDHASNVSSIRWEAKDFMCI
jgi:hypothetical protein